MKLNLYLESQGALCLIAWARETNLGVYMGVRLSPEVENVSYFQDGQRQLLQFPLMPDGNRQRIAVPLEKQTPILAIERCELILERVVDAPGAWPPPPKTSAGTTEVIVSISESRCGKSPRFHYAAYIVRNDYVAVFMAEETGRVASLSESIAPTFRSFPFECFPAHTFALIAWGER